ncbi:hypothetical protein ACH5RR_005961 [Cinchona calisaya]|uniref:E2 ubiquitin-conjugating enzyme n=1 Tax=Cinchona calisaya TaxID=153742 RepID=A0ABD3AMN9_9GENT
MAQAARLNLRMQKELKLLLTDPPPGASFPSLSDPQTSSGPSLSSIDAQIEGPEGTGYAKGLFKLKIQIPDRYPFQPPIVTFATPIYHPNIDNGGRICLDILNLPPKGAWQPSLNISTVLTSIGLLLSEPNPDDGLMHEASQEYKYNRQAFDQKARSMTEKYAKIGATEIASGEQGCQTLLKPSIELTEDKGSDTSMREDNVYQVSHKRLCGISRKLSLESSEIDQKKNDGKGVNQVAGKRLCERQMELKGLKNESEVVHSEHNQTHENPQGMWKKLSLDSSVTINLKNDKDMIDLASNQCSSTSKPQSSMDSLKSWPVVQPGFNSQQNLNQDGDSRPKFNIIDIKLEKKKLLESLDSNQETADDDVKILSVAHQSATQFESSGSHKSFTLLQTISHSQKEPQSEIVNGDGNGLTRVTHKKLGLAGRKFSLAKLGSYQCQQKDNTDNLAPNSRFPVALSSQNPTSLSMASEVDHCHERSGQNNPTFISDNLSRSTQRQPLKPLHQLSNRNDIITQCELPGLNPSKISTMQHDSCYDEKQKPKQDCREKFVIDTKKQEGTSPSCDTDSVIVLDSEDSDEEQGRAARSKLSIARRHLLGKSKS